MLRAYQELSMHFSRIKDDINDNTDLSRKKKNTVETLAHRIPDGFGQYIFTLLKRIPDTTFYEYGSALRHNTLSSMCQEVNFTAFSVWMKLGLSKRIFGNNPGQNFHKVIQMLETGPMDYDLKMISRLTERSIFELIIKNIEKNYGRIHHVTDSLTYFFEPDNLLTSFHERSTIVATQDGQAVVSRSEDLIPMTRVRLIPIPVYPKLHLIAIEIGFTDSELINLSAPEFREITFQLHLSTVPIGGDLRTANVNLNNWQRAIRLLMLNPGIEPNHACLPSELNELLSKSEKTSVFFLPLEFPLSALKEESAGFSLQSLLRGIRFFCTHPHSEIQTTDSEPNPKGNFTTLTQQSYEQISSYSKYLSDKKDTFDDQLKTEMLSELMLCALASPVYFIYIVKMGLKHLFSNLNCLNEEDWETIFNNLKHEINTHFPCEYTAEYLLEHEIDYYNSNYQDTYLLTPVINDKHPACMLKPSGIEIIVKIILQSLENKIGYKPDQKLSTPAEWFDYFFSLS